MFFFFFFFNHMSSYVCRSSVWSFSRVLFRSMTPGCRKPSFQFMVVFLVCFVNDRVRLRLPCQAPPVAIARAATQRRRRAANKKLQRNATGQATLHAIAQRMKKLASKPVLSAVIKHVMISDITQEIGRAHV